MPAAFPPGHFAKFRDLVVLAMNESSFVEKAAEALLIDWVLARRDLTTKFVHPLIRIAFKKVVEELYQNGTPPRKRSRPQPTTADAVPDDTGDESAVAVEDLEPGDGVTVEDFADLDVDEWEPIVPAQEDALGQEVAEARPLSPRTAARQEIFWNPAWRALVGVMDEPLLDGTRLGDATRARLRTNAQHAGLRQSYYVLVAESLPDDEKRVQDHLTEEDLQHLRALAQTQAGV